jgi:uracil-DNA glycosylase
MENIALENKDKVIESEIKKSSLKLNFVQEIDQTWTLCDIVDKRSPPGWKDIFKVARDEFDDLQEYLDNEERQYGRFCPEKKNLFRAFELTPLDNVKVVIVGQDPYHDRNKTDNQIRAQGLSFSVSRDADIPPSLKNIFKELLKDIPTFQLPNHGDLTNWAQQGVLLLNKCLTVNPKAPGSHKNVWNGFMYRIIEAIISTNPKCLFVMWGREAQKIGKMIRGRCPTLECGHPSGANRANTFIGCKHFSQINDHLVKSGFDPIDWNLY